MAVVGHILHILWVSKLREVIHKYLFIYDYFCACFESDLTLSLYLSHASGIGMQPNFTPSIHSLPNLQQWIDGLPAQLSEKAEKKKENEAAIKKMNKKAKDKSRRERERSKRHRARANADAVKKSQKQNEDEKEKEEKSEGEPTHGLINKEKIDEWVRVPPKYFKVVCVCVRTYVHMCVYNIMLFVSYCRIAIQYILDVFVC